MKPTLQPLPTSRNLGWMLQSVRKSKRLTQAQLASRVGVSQSRISHLEQHPEDLSVQQLLAWCSALACAPLQAQRGPRPLPPRLLGLELAIGPKDSSAPSSTPSGKPLSLPFGAPDVPLTGAVVDPLSDDDVEKHLLRVVSDDAFAGSFEPDDDFRISLAGAQEKDAFVFWDGRWMRPHGSTPTTHVYKMPSPARRRRWVSAKAPSPSHSAHPGAHAAGD